MLEPIHGSTYTYAISYNTASDVYYCESFYDTDLDDLQSLKRVLVY
jgi:hypothetical protein